MESSSRGRNLRIGVKSLDNILRSVVTVPSFRISTAIQIHTNDGIIVGKHEPDAIRGWKRRILLRKFWGKPYRSSNVGLATCSAPSSYPEPFVEGTPVSTSAAGATS